MVTIHENEYNKLKRERDASNRVAQELVSSLRDLRQKLERVEQENNKLRINAQCPETPPSSRASSCALTHRGGKPPTDFKKELMDELSRLDAAHNLVKYFHDFSDSMTKFAHEYTSEICTTSWAHVHGTISWAPNETRDCLSFVRDWRGRSHVKVGFTSEKFSSKEDVISLGAPLLQIGSEADCGAVEVLGAFYPSCAFEEARKGTMYTTTPEAESNFICQSIISLINATVPTPISGEVERSVFSIASRSKVLPLRFAYYCRQVMSTRKRNVKDVYFSSLGYTTISATRGKGSASDFVTVRAAEEAEAYGRLYHILPNQSGTLCDNRDTSFWRLAKFEDICTISARTSPVTLRSVDGVDHLFNNEPARRAYSAFRKFKVDADEETSALSIIRLDAIMTSIVDRFKPQDHTSGRRDSAVGNRSSRTGEHRSEGEVDGEVHQQAKGGRVPLESVRRFRSLLPTAASQFLQRAHALFTRALARDQYTLQTELSVRESGTDLERLNNKNRMYTIAFRYPVNRHYFIALTQHTFADCICKWVGVVTDCVLLHSRSLDGEFHLFQTSDVLDRIQEDDEDVNVQVLQEGTSTV